MCFQPSQHSQRVQQVVEQNVAAQEKATQNAEAEKQRQILLQQEADRKANIQTGNSAVDNAFTGFNDDYYNRAASTYTGAYTPQIDQQYARALDTLKSSLAGRGVLESSVGAQAIGDLAKNAATQRAGVANQGLDFANQLRGKVADSKNQLYAQSASAADPNAIASAATGSATSLAEQGQLTPTQPLGDMFGAFIQPYAAASNAAQNSAYGGLKMPINTARTTGAGSSYTVRS